MEHAVLMLGLQRIFLRYDLVNVNAFHRPTVRRSDNAQLIGRFRQRDVDNRFAQARTFREKMQGSRRFACTRLSLDQLEPLGRQAATQNLIESRHTSRKHLV